MTNILKVSSNLKNWFLDQLDIAGKTNPLIKCSNPFTKKVIDKKFGSITGFLEMITDEEGNIDVPLIMDEFIVSIKSSDPFDFEAPIVGKVEVDKNGIKVGIPYTSKNILIKVEDLETLKEVLIEE